MTEQVLQKPVRVEMPRTMEGALKLFGYKEFSPKQEQLITASVEGRDVLGILPTGKGKSACFQVPGILARQRTLVVSPLIALQHNQVLSLRKIGVKAWMLNSNMTDAERLAVYHYYKTASRSQPSFLYISPELLMTEMFHEKFDHVGFERLAVDEAHCVSTWGDSFRPDYQRIRVAAQRLMIPVCSAFTATVDKKIEVDIRKRIPLRPDFLKVSENPLRPNLNLSVVRTSPKSSPKFQTLLQLLSQPEYQGPTIIYYNSVNGAVDLYLKLRKMTGFLKDKGYTPYLFHANLDVSDKEESLKGFLNDERPLIVATSAFGMGIDRRNVRQVIHYKEPRLLIEYAQQIGRAGRDGLPSLCTTLFNLSGDEYWREQGSVERDVPTYDFIEKVLDNLINRLKRMSQEKRKGFNISHFRNRTLKWMFEESGISDYQCRVYESRFLTSLAILQRAGYIFEDDGGLRVREIIPGTKRHAELIELTQMHKRMQLREQERVTRFFNATPPTQELLWEILGE